MLVLWVSKGRPWPFHPSRGSSVSHSLECSSPTRLASGRRTVVLDGSLPSPCCASPLGRPQAECDLGAEFGQRNAASTPTPGPWEFIKCLPAIHGEGRGVTSSLPGPVLHLPRAPLPPAPSKNGQKETFAGSLSPFPPPALPPPPTPQPGEEERGRGGGRLARRPLGLALLPGGGGWRGGEARPVEPPRPASLGVRASPRGRALPPLRALAAARRHLEFRLRERGPGGGGEEDRRPAASSGIRGPERHREASGAAAAAGEAPRGARPQCISVAVRHARDAPRGALCTG